MTTTSHEAPWAPHPTIITFFLSKSNPLHTPNDDPPNKQPMSPWPSLLPSLPYAMHDGQATCVDLATHPRLANINANSATSCWIDDPPNQ